MIWAFVSLAVALETIERVVSDFNVSRLALLVNPLNESEFFVEANEQLKSGKRLFWLSTEPVTTIGAGSFTLLSLTAQATASRDEVFDDSALAPSARGRLVSGDATLAALFAQTNETLNAFAPLWDAAPPSQNLLVRLDTSADNQHDLVCVIVAARSIGADMKDRLPFDTIDEDRTVKDVPVMICAVVLANTLTGVSALEFSDINGPQIDAVIGTADVDWSGQVRAVAKQSGSCSQGAPAGFLIGSMWLGVPTKCNSKWVSDRVRYDCASKGRFTHVFLSLRYEFLPDLFKTLTVDLRFVHPELDDTGREVPWIAAPVIYDNDVRTEAGATYKCAAARAMERWGPLRSGGFGENSFTFEFAWACPVGVCVQSDFKPPAEVRTRPVRMDESAAPALNCSKAGLAILSCARIALGDECRILQSAPANPSATDVATLCDCNDKFHTCGIQAGCVLNKKSEAFAKGCLFCPKMQICNSAAALAATQATASLLMLMMCMFARSL
jgi:hypothetical protein